MATYNISNSGSPECHGEYTERGEANGFPFYNLVGKPRPALYQEAVYKIQSAATAQDPTWTLANSIAWGACATAIIAP